MTDFSSDDELMAELGAALDAVDAVPPSVGEAARELLRWRSPTASLMIMEEIDPVGSLRSSRSGSQQLRFSAAGVTVVVRLLDGEIVGEVQPSDAVTEMVVQSETAEIAVELAEGEFAARPLGSPVRLQVTVGGRSLHTEWFVVSPAGSS